MASTTSSTGVQQGQAPQTTDTTTQVTGDPAIQAGQQQQNNLATDEAQANINAYKAKQLADQAEASQDWGRAAYERQQNADYQNEANADYAASMAGAQALGGAMNALASSAASSASSGAMGQIQAATGVQQGQTAGATSVQQAMQQTTATTGVQQGQSVTSPSTDTSYTHAADAQQAALNATSQQNETDAQTAAQAWQTGLPAQYSANAANKIASYDNSMAASTGDPNWTSAAAIAQAQADQQQTIFGQQQAIQTSATNDGNATNTAANAEAPGVGNTLDSAASAAATANSTNTLNQIGAATGVPQNGQ